MNTEMKTPIEKWLDEYAKKPSVIEKYINNFDLFLEWVGKTDVELVQSYKDAKDKLQWRKEMGSTLVRWYNHLLTPNPTPDRTQPYASNTARALVNTVRSFFNSQCDSVKIKRGAIAKTKMAMNEHEFRLEELRLMYRVGNLKEKALLSTAISLGVGASDFVELTREFIEPFLNEDLEVPVGFWNERIKTGATQRAHLTHESIADLRDYLKTHNSKWVFPNHSEVNHLTTKTLNDNIKTLFRKANIEKRGTVRFHLIRKFLMSQLANSGINHWHIKLMVAKTIPQDILTYLKDQTEALRQEFSNAEERFVLSGTTNHQHNKFEAMEQEINTLKDALATIVKVAVERGALKKEDLDKLHNNFPFIVEEDEE